MLKGFQLLFKERVKSVLKNTAILHSLSFILELKEPQKFGDFTKD